MLEGQTSKWIDGLLVVRATSRETEGREYFKIFETEEEYKKWLQPKAKKPKPPMSSNNDNIRVAHY